MINEISKVLEEKYHINAEDRQYMIVRQFRMIVACKKLDYNAEEIADHIVNAERNLDSSLRKYILSYLGIFVFIGVLAIL